MDLELDVKKMLTAPPVMPWREFADWIAMKDEHDVVEAWIKRGYLPTVKIGKYRMVNVALLTKNLLDAEDDI